MIECRGRNGWFRYDSHQVLNGQETTCVSIYSSRRGEFPPIYLQGPKAEVLELLDQLRKEVKEA